MDRWRLMEMEYMNEYWMDIKMEEGCLDIGQIGRRTDVRWMGGCGTDGS